MRLRTTSFLIALIAVVGFALPSVSFAASLTADQTNAVIGLLQAFGVDQATISQVRIALGDAVPVTGGGTPSVPSAPTVATTPRVLPVGNVYPASAIGYDLSFATTAYPVDRFGFAVVGVNGGKAFVPNPRLASQYSWAHFASAVAPTIYMNLNGPYGSSVAGNTAAPKDCTNAVVVSPTSFAQTVASRGTGAYPEPSTCAAYNYGYNAAKDAYLYAKSAGIRDTFWWLDIEEANSWSANPAVNDATIQGALDYLNSVGIKVGIYSVPYMWQDIAGVGFTPTETVNGSIFPVPTWFPIGIETQVGAINACVTKRSFIPGSPIWMLQYVLDHVAIDQNVAC